MNTTENHWIITLICHDQPGIVHAISGAIVASGGNITESQQFASEDTGRFFMRLQVTSDNGKETLEQQLAPVAARFDMEWKIDLVGRKVPTLILASTAEHCLNDLLYRTGSGFLPIEITRVLSNHNNLQPLTQFHNLPLEHIPILSNADKQVMEERILEVVEQENIELVVLARYMQILSPELCEKLHGMAINIHHSFLPGFKGANPYRQAHARGVKLIGATAHFVTPDLDEGPIIQQNVVRVNHSKNVEELVAIGQDEESRTLVQAVRWFAEHRVLMDGERTIIFE